MDRRRTPDGLGRERFDLKPFAKPGVLGWLHDPAGDLRAAVVLTHGAGSNCEAPFLMAAAKSLAEAGYAVLRCDLPFRQAGGGGAMNAAAQARDRAGIVTAASELRALFPKTRMVLAGHSYGGRQASMLAAEDPSQADALLLLSYPLHPPRQPEKARTEHFPKLRKPALFVHGSRDPFGTIEELEEALKLISSKVMLKPVPKGPHNLPVAVAGSVPEWLAEVL